MNIAIEIKKLSRPEKLKVMEALWEDLCQDDNPIQSPDWHADALRETEIRFQNGEENIVDWSEAKKKLRKRFK